MTRSSPESNRGCHDSRQVKRNLRVRKRFVLAEKRAGRIAQTMDTKQLVEALRERGFGTEGSEDLDQLRRVFVEGIQPEIRVRLHATSRYMGSSHRRLICAPTCSNAGDSMCKQSQVGFPSEALDKYIHGRYSRRYPSKLNKPQVQGAATAFTT